MTETTHQQRIEDDLKSALKARDKARVSTLRLLLAEIKNERIRRGEEVDEVGFFGLVRKGVKQCHEAAEKYREGGREDSAAKEEREAEILEAYLPRQADETEIRKAVEDFVAQEELSGPGAIGPVMKAMMAKFGGRADGGTLNKIARDVLSGGGSG
jgi:uncharacterized protein YqeY